MMNSQKITASGILIVSLGLCLLFLHDSINELLGWFTRPMVVLSLHLFGWEASSTMDAIRVGQLVVPWSSDCSGYNILFALVGIAAWSHGLTRMDWGLFGKLLLALPLAYFSNVLRVLSLVAYRGAFYPEIESAELHYFLGFVWMIPFGVLYLVISSKLTASLLVDLFYYSVVFGMVSPYFEDSGSVFLITAMLMCLAFGQGASSFYPGIAGYLLLWGLAGGFISWTGIDSLWIPWLICFPAKISGSWMFSWRGVFILAACPLWALVPGMNLLVFGLAAGTFFMGKGALRDSGKVSDVPGWRNGVVAFASVLVMSLPLTHSWLIPEEVDPEAYAPPDHIAKRTLPQKGYELRFARQPRQMATFWYTPQSRDRHHSLSSCMAFRGVHLERVENLKLLKDEKHFYRELFILEDRVVESHLEYLFHTLGIRRSPGVHLIFVGPQHAFEGGEFVRVTDELLQELLEKST